MFPGWEPRSRFGYRLWYYSRAALSLPFRRPSATLCTAIVFWTVVWNAGVYMVYGAEEPTNRFMWRLRERQGRLTEEQKRKKAVVDAYFLEKSLSWKEDRDSRHIFPEQRSFAELWRGQPDLARPDEEATRRELEEDKRRLMGRIASSS